MNKFLYFTLLSLITVGIFLSGITFAFEGSLSPLFALLWLFVALIFLNKQVWKRV